MTNKSGLLGSGAFARPIAERRVAAVATTFCAAVYALTYTFDSVPDMSGLGAELFPRLVLAAMILLAVLMALGIDAPAKEAPAPVHRTAWIVGGAMAAYMGAIELIGTWPASFAFLVVVGWIWGERSLIRLAAAALGLCAALHLLFVRLLGISFPAGLPGDILR